MEVRSVRSNYGLEHHGIQNVDEVFWNLTTPHLYEEALRRREGRLAHLGPLVVRTGHHTGRSPNDKFVVREPSSAERIWWGQVNRPMEPEHFERLHRRLLAYLRGKDVFIQDCYVGGDPAYRIPIRVITETAWHNLFARVMFIRPPREILADHVPEFTVIHAPHFHAIPDVDGTRSEVVIAIHFGKRLVLIGGTQYAGEIKKSVFTLLNYLLPQRGVFSMHCSANMSAQGDVALFFGLSGTGKTTLSADPSRILIGDDEHGWSDHGIFNFEGGCYAKVIRLSPLAEPEIFAVTRRFGTILENVGMDSATGRLNLDDDSLTENTRAAYPILYIPHASPDGIGGHPRTVIMLTADAFGVLPPIARLSQAQAMYYFLSGYTAKVAGTERGVTEPQATFSACFGGPFMALSPIVYAEMLGDRLRRHGATVWLINTGWSGGPAGQGQRIRIDYTRAMVSAAVTGALDEVPMRTGPIFGLTVPRSVPGVPDEVLTPRQTWSDQAAYDAQTRRLAGMFAENFKAFADQVPAEVRDVGPRV